MQKVGKYFIACIEDAFNARYESWPLYSKKVGKNYL